MKDKGSLKINQSKKYTQEKNCQDTKIIPAFSTVLKVR